MLQPPDQRAKQEAKEDGQRQGDQNLLGEIKDRHRAHQRTVRWPTGVGRWQRTSHGPARMQVSRHGCVRPVAQSNAATGDQLDHQHHEGHHENDVDQGPDVENREAQEPEDEQDNDECVKHGTEWMK